MTLINVTMTSSEAMDFYAERKARQIEQENKWREQRAAEAKAAQDEALYVNRFRTFSDILKWHGISAARFKTRTNQMDKDALAGEKLKLICLCFNKGKKIDWSNESEKYYPKFMMKEGVFKYTDDCHVTRKSSINHKFYFLTKSGARRAGKHFESIYRDFLIWQ